MTSRCGKWLLSIFLLLPLPGVVAADAGAHTQVRELKIAILSTMLTGGRELGEWGFAALVEVDGHKILYDTGGRPDLVLENARMDGIGFKDVPDVILSHNHWDHVGGLLTLRRSVLPDSPTALAVAHVGKGIFYSRGAGSDGNDENPMIAIKPEYEATGGVFVVHDKPDQLYPGVWLTGPVPRKYPEHNWSGTDKVVTPDGTVEDTIPEDMALVFDTPKGLVVLTGCGHAGVANIIEYSRDVVRPAPVFGLIGGLHLFNASDKTLAWTAGKLRGFGVENFIGAHCTGIEPVIRFRRDLGLDRAHAVVGQVGATFTLADGIDAGRLAH